MADTTTTKIIKSIQLPTGDNGTNEIYKIYDESAVHNVEDLGLSAALVFKGIKSPKDGKTGEQQIFALTSAKVGDVYLANDTNTEYVCVKEITSTADSTAWEKLGNVHDAASSTHIHAVTPTTTKINTTTQKMVLGEASKVKTNGSVGNGKPAKWSASVDNNGVLSFTWETNNPTSVTLPTFEKVDVATGGISETGEGSSVVTGIASNATTGVSVVTGINTVSPPQEPTSGS